MGNREYEIPALLVLSLIVVFSGLMLENVITNTAPFLNLIVGETADSCINVQTEAEDDFLRKMDADDRVNGDFIIIFRKSALKYDVLIVYF